MLCLVQARLSSSRLPGKVLAPIKGIPLIQLLVSRLSRSSLITNLVIATSITKSDDPIYAFCNHIGVECWRGSLINVAARMQSCAISYSADYFMRISADSPFMDPSIVDKLISTNYSEYDITTNVYPRTYPKGQSAEIVRTASLTRLMRANSISPSGKEHVTSDLYNRDHLIKSIRMTKDYSHINI